MNFRTEHFEHAHAGASHANVPVRVPFAEFVEPFLYVGEEMVRLGFAMARVMFSAAGAVDRWRNQRATVKALQGLEDHRLDDIGVRREDIAKLAHKLANG
jgi:uncharacterized protein YjiS (DUF1127 family)